jgi:hypothetical protein
MKVICNYHHKCKVIEDFNETFCPHSHDHDKKSGCECDVCGLLDNNGIDVKVYCKPATIFKRKQKLEKLNETML